MLHRISKHYENMPSSDQRKIVIDMINNMKKESLIEKNVPVILKKELQKTGSLGISSIRTVCHNCLKPEHFLWRNGRISGLIDFDLAGRDRPLHDVAFCIAHICFDTDGNFNESSASTFIKAYEKNSQEKMPTKLLGAFIRLALLKIICWEVYDNVKVFKKKIVLKDIKTLKRLESMENYADEV